MPGQADLRTGLEECLHPVEKFEMVFGVVEGTGTVGRHFTIIGNSALVEGATACATFVGYLVCLLPFNLGGVNLDVACFGFHSTKRPRQRRKANHRIK